MDESVRALVWQRAGGRCEYCRLAQEQDPVFTFHVEHLIAKQHGGPDDETNLALACYHCNLHKGPNLTGIDVQSHKLARLFNPRRQRWARHFRWDGPRLVGRTQIGRATVAVLAMNHPDRVKLREWLIAEGASPPHD